MTARPVAPATTATPATADTATGTTALDVRGVAVTLGGRRVLDGVSLAVGDGELVGILGPNGAGKTTLLRATLGLLALDRGSVAIGGRVPSRARALVGYVPQRHEFAWDFPISVAGAVLSSRAANAGLLRRASRADRRAVADAVDRVGLGDLADRPIGELSGGQRQRVLVARALARGPRLLLLDEPFTGVDAPTRDLLSALLTDLTADGHAILMTTHDMPAAAATCSRLCLLNRIVVADGPPAELADPDVWLRAFGGSSTEILLAALGVHADGRARQAAARDAPPEPSTVPSAVTSAVTAERTAS